MVHAPVVGVQSDSKAVGKGALVVCVDPLRINNSANEARLNIVFFIGLVVKIVEGEGMGGGCVCKYSFGIGRIVPERVRSSFGRMEVWAIFAVLLRAEA